MCKLARGEQVFVRGCAVGGGRVSACYLSDTHRSFSAQAAVNPTGSLAQTNLPLTQPVLDLVPSEPPSQTEKKILEACIRPIRCAGPG